MVKSPTFYRNTRTDVRFCEIIGDKTTYGDLLLMIGGSPKKSYAISCPCMKVYSGDEKFQANCADENKCRDHYLTLTRLADNERIEPLDSVNDLRKGRPSIARISEDLYRKIVMIDSELETRNKNFRESLNEYARGFDSDILNDLDNNKEKTFMETARMLSQTKQIKIKPDSIIKEAKRYSFVNNASKYLEELDLIKDSNLSVSQVSYGDDIIWILTGKTSWDDCKEFVLELEKNSASLSLIKSETKYSSSIVKMDDSNYDFSNIEKLVEQVCESVPEIEHLITNEPILSPKGAFVDIASTLDDRRIKHYTTGVI